MANILHISKPVTISRPRGAHRFEAFSPKLARRVTFYRRALLEQWLLLEANPNVISFCERPGYVLIDGKRRLADFWVRSADHEELIMLIDEASNPDVEALGCDLDAPSHVRLVPSAELAATRDGRTTGSASSPTSSRIEVSLRIACHWQSRAS